MLTATPFVPNLNVEEVDKSTGLPIVIVSVGLTSEETKAKIDNAREYTLTFTSNKLPKEKFPDGRAQRMFSPSSDLAKQLAILSGQKETNGSYPIDEDKLAGKTAVLIRVKSGGKFGGQDTLTIKR